MALRWLADATLQGWVSVTKERGSTRSVSILSKRIQELQTPEKGLVLWTKQKPKACSPEVNKKIGQVRSQEMNLGIQFSTRSWLYQEKRDGAGVIRGPASWRVRQMAIWQYFHWWCMCKQAARILGVFLPSTFPLQYLEQQHSTASIRLLDYGDRSPPVGETTLPAD